MRKRPLSLGLIGVGRWGRHLARNFRSFSVLSAVCDRDPNALAAYRDADPKTLCTSNENELFENESISAIAIATPARHHYELARRALLSGKDVYVEKPLCLSALQAQELCRLAAEGQQILMVGHLLQYHPAVIRLHQLVQTGELGSLYYLASNRLNLGVIGMAGSALWDLAPHDLSVVLSLCSPNFPEVVHCAGGAFLEPNTPDLGLISLKFEGNLRAHIFVSWLHPYKEHRLTVIGSEGMAVFNDTEPWPQKLQLYRGAVDWDEMGRPVAKRVQPEFIELAPQEPLQSECAHFISCCETRQTPRTDGSEAVRVLRILQVGEESLRLGLPLELLEKTLDNPRAHSHCEL